MPKTKLDLSEEEILQCLEQALVDHPAEEYPDFSKLLSGPPRPAAVLVPLLRKEGVWHLLLTRRNADLPEHSGQVAFPGGRADPEDASPEQTALREAQEEIGLDPNDVRILGRMQTFLTTTNYHVTPIVGTVPWPYPFRLASEEVSRVFTIPLAWLADPLNHEIQEHSLLPPYKPVPVIYFQSFDGEVLWGASARLTLKLLEILVQNGARAR
ncbi:MAG: CoA pyrophosphatase [Anaerolineales bacterium]|nr:CoA pyrophosphatase [Anaerolineales bacterium]